MPAFKSVAICGLVYLNVANPAKSLGISLRRSFPFGVNMRCNPKPKNLRQGERNPFNVAHDDLANYSAAFILPEVVLLVA